MTVALIDDQLLGAVLRGRPPRALQGKDLFTTGCWYVRLCQAVTRGDHRPGALSKPFVSLPPEDRERAVRALVDLPPAIGLLSLRHLGPSIGALRQESQLNLLGVEALAAAVDLDAEVHVTAASPRLEAALETRGLRVRRTT